MVEVSSIFQLTILGAICLRVISESEEDPNRDALKEWLKNVKRRTDLYITKSGSGYSLPYRATAIPLSTASRDYYDSWPSPSHNSYGYSSYGGYTSHPPQHQTPHVEYVPYPVHKKHDHHHEYFWPLLIALFLPLLLGAIFIPFASTFLTNLISLLTMMQQNSMNMQMQMQMANSTGRRRKRSFGIKAQAQENLDGFWIQLLEALGKYEFFDEEDQG